MTVTKVLIHWQVRNPDDSGTINTTIVYEDNSEYSTDLFMDSQTAEQLWFSPLITNWIVSQITGSADNYVGA